MNRVRDMIKDLLEHGWNTTKVLSPTAAFFGFLSIGDVKELTMILGALVTMGCTVAVAISTIRKNNAEVRKTEKNETGV
jgi:hypothetical protein